MIYFSDIAQDVKNERSVFWFWHLSPAWVTGNMAPVLYSALMIFECSGEYVIEEEDLFQLSCGHEVPLSMS